MKAKALQFGKAMSAALFVLLLSVAGMTKTLAQSFTPGNLNYPINDKGLILKEGSRTRDSTDVVIGDLCYSLDNGTLTATVTGHKDGQSATGSLSIPSSVTYTSYENGNYVPRIYSVTAVADSAFYACYGLAGTLTLPESIVMIGNCAFYYCNLTGDLVIPENVETIGKWAFAWCDFTSIHYNAIDCTSIGLMEGEYYYAFWCNYSLQEIVIGDNVIQIPAFAFTNHTSPSCTLDLGHSVQIINEYAFYNWSNVNPNPNPGLVGDLVIPTSVIEIGNSAFQGCTGLTGVLTISENVTRIGMRGFVNCGFSSIHFNATNCESMGLDESYQYIYYVFWQNYNLQEIVIGENVTQIPDFAFGARTSQNCHLTFLGNSVTRIGSYAFIHDEEDDLGLVGELVIPSSVTEIGYNAFNGCTGLTEIWSKNTTAPLIQNNTFYGVNKTIPVHVPCSSQNSYQNASYWSEFSNYSENPHVLVARTNDEHLGSASVVQYGDCTNNVCILQAIPYLGTFVNWTTPNGAVVSTDAIYTFAITQDMVLTANFSGDVVGIGDGTNTTYQFPVNSLYKYSFTEMIYTSEEVGTAGLITSIGFHFNGNNVLNRSVVVYMKNVSRSTFASATDYEGVTLADIVYTGAFMSEAVDGWVTITLDTPFFYDGNSNLMIAIDDNTGSWSSRYFYYTSTTDAGLCYYNDNVDPDPYNLDSFSGSKIVSANRPNVQLGIMGGKLTVYDGSATNSYVPVYGLFCDAYLKCEYVMPATELTEMVGSNISAMTYYLSSPASDSWDSAHFQVFMKEVDFTSIDSYQGMDGATLVYEGSLDGTQTEMNIFFTTPYHYNGGNLLIGIYNTVMGTYMPCYFYGETVSGASVQGYSYNSLDEVACNQHDFLPKTTFRYHLLNSYQQSIALQAGWNWFSTYIEASNPVALLQMLETALGEKGLYIESSELLSTEYLDGEWIGDLEEVGITNEQMYLIQTSAACTIELQGHPTNPANHVITIHPEWNWVGYPCSEEMTIAEALAGLVPEDGDQIESMEGYAEYLDGEWLGLETLKPGKGFLYYSNSDVPKTFTFPVSAK